MKNEDQSAYPMYNELGNLYSEGLSKREKLAMEIYARTILSEPMVRSFVTQIKEEVGNELFLEIAAKH